MGIIKKPKSPHIFHLSPIMQQKWSKKEQQESNVNLPFIPFASSKAIQAPPKKKVQTFKVLMPKK